MSDSGIFKFDDEKYRYIPGPLFTIVKEFHIEENVFKKSHRLINVFEWIYKWHSVLVVSDLMRGNKIAEDMKLFLSQVLREPSMGNWYYIFDYALEEMSAFSIDWVNLETLRAKHKRHGIVSFRNKYAHGAIPDDDECVFDCKEYYPVLQDLLDSKIMNDLRLLVGHSGSTIMLLGPDEISVEKDVPSGQAAVLLPDGQLLDIWPLGVYQEDPLGIKGKGFYFFNSIRQKKEAIEQLSYELPSLRRNTNFWRPFLKVFPLKDWGQLPGWDFENFRSNIEQLTENFKGRELELREIKDFMLNGHGTFMVWGGPGIGKSALVAKALKVVRAESSKTASPSNGIIIEYFIERSSFYASVSEYLRYVNKKLDKYYKIKGIPIGNDESEMRIRLEERLNRIENKINNEMVLLVVDGLDECPEIRNYIPKSRYWLNVLILSREIVEVKDWWRTHDRENKSEKNLEILSDNEIISLLYDVVDKYQKGFNKEYVFEVCRRSEGNPLYLKLLCEQIYSYGGIVESIDKIPANWSELYTSAVKRISQQPGGMIAINVLRVLSVAKDALSVNLIQVILNEIEKKQYDIQQIFNAVDLCREFLFVREVDINKSKYSLFHDTFRKWFVNNHGTECKNINFFIDHAVMNWKSINNQELLGYVLRFGVDHLLGSNKEDAIWRIITDDEYYVSHLNIFKNYLYAICSVNKCCFYYANIDKSKSIMCFLKLYEISKSVECIVDEYAFDYDNFSINDAKKFLNEFYFYKDEKFIFIIVLLLFKISDKLDKMRDVEGVFYLFGVAEERCTLFIGLQIFNESFIKLLVKKIVANLDFDKSMYVFKFVSKFLIFGFANIRIIEILYELKRYDDVISYYNAYDCQDIKYYIGNSYIGQSYAWLRMYDDAFSLAMVDEFNVSDESLFLDIMLIVSINNKCIQEKFIKIVDQILESIVIDFLNNDTVRLWMKVLIIKQNLGYNININELKAIFNEELCKELGYSFVYFLSNILIYVSNKFLFDYISNLLINTMLLMYKNNLFDESHSLSDITQNLINSYCAKNFVIAKLLVKIFDNFYKNNIDVYLSCKCYIPLLVILKKEKFLAISDEDIFSAIKKFEYSLGDVRVYDRISEISYLISVISFVGNIKFVDYLVYSLLYSFKGKNILTKKNFLLYFSDNNSLKNSCFLYLEWFSDVSNDLKVFHYQKIVKSVIKQLIINDRFSYFYFILNYIFYKLEKIDLWKTDYDVLLEDKLALLLLVEDFVDDDFFKLYSKILYAKLNNEIFVEFSISKERFLDIDSSFFLNLRFDNIFNKNSWTSLAVLYLRGMNKSFANIIPDRVLLECSFVFVNCGEYKKALSLSKIVNNLISRSLIFSEIAIYFFKINNFSMSEHYINRSILIVNDQVNFSDSHESRFLLLAAYSYIFDFMCLANLPAQAILYLNKFAVLFIYIGNDIDNVCNLKLYLLGYFDLINKKIFDFLSYSGLNKLFKDKIDKPLISNLLLSYIGKYKTGELVENFQISTEILESFCFNSEAIFAEHIFCLMQACIDNNYIEDFNDIYDKLSKF